MLVLIFLLMKAVVLPTVKISTPQFIRVTSVIALCVAALSFNASNIQAIGSYVGEYSGLFQVTAITQVIDCFFCSMSLDIELCQQCAFVHQAFIATCVLSKSAPSDKSFVKLTQEQLEILVGVMLGDAHLEQSTTKLTARLILDQTFPAHAFYLTTLYIKFQNLFGTAPRVVIRKPDKRTGKVYSSIRCVTLQYPCLGTVHKMFYDGKVKVLPTNIGELLTARALAYWIMDDGAKGSRGETILHSQSFTLVQNQLLQEVLMTNFGLRTRLIEKKPDQWIIIIPLVQKGTPLRHIVSQHMCVSMMHKI